MKKKKDKKKLVIVLSIFFVLLFVGGWNVIDGNYDKQNKVILALKKFVPSKISRKIRDTIFVIPDLKTLNKDLELQVRKFEQDLDGQLFDEKEIKTKKKIINYKNFFLPFPRLDVRAGYTNPSNSARAHYLEVVGDKILVLSGQGKTIFFEKKNIFEKKLEQEKIQNNINDIMTKNNLTFIGVRDLFVDKNIVYISLISKNEKGYTFNIYTANLNYKKLDFKIFFETKQFFKEYSVSTGGRIEKFKNDKILFTIGNSGVLGAPQDKNSLLGKIISIDLNTKNYELVSIGHRNQQGIAYDEDLNLIINSEHGPKGGDEINFNYYKKNSVLNFGFDVVSYGIEYDGTDPYKRPHSDFGFVEPIKYYVPSIGISEIIFLNKEKSFLKKNSLFVSSLRAGSLYIYELNDQLDKIESEERINFGNERIRDIKYDPENNVFFLIFEITPSIVVLKIKD
jgi:glucose/arabinose dehydrogenase